MKKINNFIASIKPLFQIYLLLFLSVNITTADSVIGINHNLNLYRKNIIKEELKMEVDRYIKTIAPSSKLSGGMLVEECIRHDFDLIFALSQAHLESKFGTRGMASKTNSVWNVWSMDGYSFEYIKENGKHYRSADESISPYIRLVKEYYMSDGKSYDDLLVNYININGHRFATDKRYEKKLKILYNRIQNERLTQLYDMYTSL